MRASICENKLLTSQHRKPQEPVHDIASDLGLFPLKAGAAPATAGGMGLWSQVPGFKSQLCLLCASVSPLVSGVNSKPRRIQCVNVCLELRTMSGPEFVQ